MAKVKAILFDKDGTLYDFQMTYGAWAVGLVHMLAGDDPVLAEVLATELKLDLAQCQFAPGSVAIAGTVTDIRDALAPHLPFTRDDLYNRIDSTAHDVPLTPVVPLQSYLEGLSDLGVELGVVTNDSETSAKAHLDRTGILGCFGFIAGYDSGFGAKPAPGPLWAGARALGARPEETLMVGDSRHDLLAGRAAGMTTVGVLTGVADGDDLDPLADVVLSDIGDLPDWLGGR